MDCATLEQFQIYNIYQLQAASVEGLSFLEFRIYGYFDNTNPR